MVNLIELGLIEVKLSTWLSLSVADDLDEDWILLKWEEFDTYRSI